MKGKTRCRMHGGASTGPKTSEGKARVVAAMVEGRRKWVALMRAEGKKLTCGRKAGDAWITPKMRQRQEAEVRARERELAHWIRTGDPGSLSLEDRRLCAKEALRALQARFEKSRNPAS
jgi:hypothetical protein